MTGFGDVGLALHPWIASPRDASVRVRNLVEAFGIVSLPPDTDLRTSCLEANEILPSSCSLRLPDLSR